MNGPRQVETVNALALTLHGVRIGILAHYSGGKNILTFDPQYQRLPIEERPVFTLSQKVRADYLTSPLMASQPFLRCYPTYYLKGPCVIGQRKP